MTGNSKTAPIDLFPGQLLGCTTTAATATATAPTTTATAAATTAPCMPKYHSLWHRAQYHSTTVQQYNSTTVEKYLFPGRSVSWLGDVHYCCLHCAQCVLCTLYTLCTVHTVHSLPFEDPFFKCTSSLSH